jgi:membrane fusion protein, multidrug efflux system
MTRRRRIAVVAAAIVSAFALYEIATSFLAYTADAYVDSDLVAIAPEVTGRIVAVHVADNQDVAAGDLLASIDPEPFQLAVDQRRAEVEEARAQLAVDSDSVRSVRDALVAATSAADYAHQSQARLSALAKDRDIARAALDQGEDDMRRADAALDAAKQAVARAEATRTMHQAAEARAAAEHAGAQWQLSQTKLTAPVSGTVTNLKLSVGDTARTGAPLIGVVSARAWRIVANYPENYIRAFTPDAVAWVWLDSEPWRLHRAKIAGVARGIHRDPAPGLLLAYVAPTTDWIRLQRRFPVRLTLVDAPPDLKLYMGADARVLILP